MISTQFKKQNKGYIRTFQAFNRHGSLFFGYVMIFSGIVAFFGFKNRIEGEIIMRKGLGSQIA